MAVRVVERWIDDEKRAQEAREYLEFLIGRLAVRQLLDLVRRERNDSAWPTK